jgi:hypothetical protein
MLAAKRLRAHLALFAALFGVVAIIAGASGGLAGYLTGETTSGVRAAFSAATGSEAALRVEVRSAGETQDAELRETAAARFSGAPLLIDRTVQSEPTVAIADGREVRIVLASLPLQERATLVSGSWAARADEGVLQDAAATLLDLAPGDVVEFPDGRAITITGTWSALDALDPIWFGESLASSGVDGDAVGPLVVAEDAYAELRPFARWVITPDPALVTAGDLGPIVTGTAGLREALSESETFATGNVLSSGGLEAFAAELAGSIDALAGIAPVPAVLLGAIGIVALVELARLLVRVRIVETALLRSRGASPQRIMAGAAAEAAAVAIPAAALGAALAQVATGVGEWPIALAVALATVIAFCAVALLDARRPLSRESAQDSGRGRRVAGYGLVVLALAAAAVSVWQFRLYGSPIVRGADGRSNVDPIAVLAPTLALVAGALLVVLALAPASAGLQALTRRGRVGWALAGWQLARRVTVFATPVLLVALAVGGVVVAGAYSATWERATTIAREAGNGAAVRVATAWPIADLPDVDAASPALTATLQVGDDAVQLLALPAELLPAVVEPAGGTVDAAALAAAIATTPALPLPEGTTALESDAEVSFWLVDALGAVQRIEAPFAVPEGAWSLGGVEFPDGAPQPLEVAAVTPGGVAALDLDDWVVAPGVDAQPLRLVPSGALELPIAVSQSFADRGALELGDEVTLRFAGTGRHVVGTIAAVVAVVPGTPDGFAVAVDLPGFAAQQLALASSVPAADEVWIATAHPAEVGAALAGPGILVTTIASRPGDLLLAAGRGALWIGAVGALVLAAAAVSAIAGAMLRDRAGEVVVLRVIGTTARGQAASRRRELALVLGWSALGGAGVGTIVSVLTVAGLARSAVLGAPEALPTTLALDAGIVGVVLGVFALVLAVLVVVYGARVTAQARTLSVREDAR